MNKYIIILLALFSKSVFSYTTVLNYDESKLTYEEKANFIRTHLFYMKQSVDSILKVDKYTKLEKQLMERYKFNGAKATTVLWKKVAGLLGYPIGIGCGSASLAFYSNIPAAKLSQFKKIPSSSDTKRPGAIMKFAACSLAAGISAAVFLYSAASLGYFANSTKNIEKRAAAINWTIYRVHCIKELIGDDQENFKDIVDYNELINFTDKFKSWYVKTWYNEYVSLCSVDIEWAKFYKDLTLQPI